MNSGRLSYWKCLSLQTNFNTELLLFDDQMIFYFRVSKSISLLPFFYEVKIYYPKSRDYIRLLSRFGKQSISEVKKNRTIHFRNPFYIKKSNDGTVLVNMLCMITTHMDTMKPTYLPVDLLWKYREFKRDEIPSPKVSSFNTRDVDEVMEYIRANGLEPVELSIVGKKALLTDGNHRIVAARRLGYCVIPVNVTKYAGNGEESFYEHTLQRFKPIDIHLNLELRIAFDPKC